RGPSLTADRIDNVELARYGPASDHGQNAFRAFEKAKDVEVSEDRLERRRQIGRRRLSFVRLPLAEDDAAVFALDRRHLFVAALRAFHARSIMPDSGNRRYVHNCDTMCVCRSYPFVSSEI